MTRKRTTRRGATAWLLAVAIALVGAITLFAGALPAAATVPAETITGVSPLSGSYAGGTVLTFTGTGFTTAPSSVTIGGVAATNITTPTPTQFSATTPAGSGANQVIAVMFTDGAASVAQTFSYASPTITNVSPAFGPIAGGNNVVISGANFGPSGAPSVTFDGVAATPVSNSDTSITVKPASHVVGPVDVVVTVALHASSPANYLYQNAPAPAISSLNPTSTAAGQNVNINGSNFAPPGGACGGNGLNGTVQVFYGAVQAQCNVSDNTVIFSTVPAGTGTVSVTVVTVNGTSNGVTFTYGSGSTPPNILSVSPSSGPAGITLTISGTNLAPSSGVTVGGVNCPLLTGSGTQLTCTVPNGTVTGLAVNVVVSAIGGSATAFNAFTYTNISPVTVTSVVPNVCPLGGGNTLYVYGTGFVNGSTSVSVNGVGAANVNVIGSGQLSVTCPGQLNYGTYDLIVTVGANSSPNTVNDNVTYQVGGAAPVISDVEPNNGPTTGGTAVTITGGNFTSPATVTFDGIAATSVVVQSTSMITAVTPAHATVGLVNVSVSTGSGVDTDVYAFTYTNQSGPTVTSISPASGPSGTTITITGTNFLNATSVTVGGVAATFTVVSSTSISAVVASGTPLGVVDVIVTTPYGTSPNTVADNFTNTSSHTITTTLQGFFTLIGWVGIDNISVADALRGGPNGPTGGTNDITSLVSVVWGFNSATQTFQAYFPASANVPGANDLTALHSGQGYFIGLVNPNSIVQWTYMLGA